LQKLNGPLFTLVGGSVARCATGAQSLQSIGQSPWSIGEIAKSLLMSEGTAKAHVSRILTKLDCTNRVQAAILAHDAGLLPPA
jgi:DNA-binding CsgD family transcriptional regulator